jgi:hypothetical protein
MSSPTSTATPAENEGFTHRQILMVMSGLMLGMFLGNHGLDEEGRGGPRP